MKLLLLEELKVRRFEQVAKLRHANTFHINQAAAPEKHASYDRAHQYRTTAEIGYSQIHKTGTPEEQILNDGTRAIMREVYGPIAHELFLVTKELRDYGITGADKPYLHLWNIIDTLEGKNIV